MKLLALLVAAFGLVSVALPALVAIVVATHPWLAVGVLVGPVEVVQPTPAPVAAAPPALAPAPALAGTPAAIIAEAMKWVNARVPYRWGGCTPAGVDCSCFVRNVLAVFGIHAPRTTVEQIHWATPIAREQLAVGDIVFFNDTCTECGANPTHEGLYIGGGLMVQAGDPVQVSPVFRGYYAAHFAGAGRPH